MSVFPEKSLKIYYFARSAKNFWPYPPRICLPPPRKLFGAGAGGGKNLGGAMPPLLPHLSPLWLKLNHVSVTKY